MRFEVRPVEKKKEKKSSKGVNFEDLFMSRGVKEIYFLKEFLYRKMHVFEKNT